MIRNSEPPQKPPRIVLVAGQQHFDPAWQRPPEEYEELRENMLLKVFRIMDLYPEWTWSFDQKCVLEEFLRKFPEREGLVRKAIAQGRIELVGGQITIPDANLPGPEAQVRQHLYGKRWMEKTFGAEVQVAWYYDTFGLHPQLPQILARCGFKYLHAIRFCRQDVEPPFSWQGIDGSTILTHSRDYSHNSWDYLFIDDALNQIRTLANSHKFIVDPTVAGDQLPPYFHQPNDAPILWYEPHSEEEMPSYRVAQKIAQWNHQQKDFHFRFAIPREYFEQIVASGSPIKTFTGEFNPEFTGCYTSRPWHKRQNRQVETLLYQAEALGVLAQAGGFQPDTAALQVAWEELALVQHHDGITGCHIDSVDAYVRGKLDHALALAQAEQARAREHLTEKDNSQVCVFNTLGWPCARTVCLPGDRALLDENGNELPARISEAENGCQVEVLLPEIAGLAFHAFSFGSQTVSPSKPVLTDRLENDFYTVTLGSGALESIGLKVGPENLTRSDRSFAELALEEDNGNLYYEQLTDTRVTTGRTESRGYQVAGDRLGQTVVYRGRLIAPWCEGVLEYEQAFLFPHHSPLIEMRVRLNWQGANSRVVARFPTCWPEVNTAIYEIPFGAIERSSYRDRGYAKDSLWPAQNWAALSHDRVTFVVYNQGTGGGSVRDGQLKVSLLRSVSYQGGWQTDMIGHPSGPGALACGPQEFRLFFEFRTGRWQELGLARRGFEINHPLIAQGGAPAHLRSCPGVSIEPSSIVTTAVKHAEENPQAVIMRLYESVGNPTTAKLRLGSFWPKGFFCPCDLLENPTGKTAGIGADGSITLNFTPFEIKTIMLVPDDLEPLTK